MGCNHRRLVPAVAAARGWLALAAAAEPLRPADDALVLANVPAVMIGERLARRLPLTAIRWIAAAVFVATGIVTMVGAPGRPI
jgi:uncharacterized membrane protein YfcA